MTDYNYECRDDMLQKYTSEIFRRLEKCSNAPSIAMPKLPAVHHSNKETKNNVQLKENLHKIQSKLDFPNLLLM